MNVLKFEGRADGCACLRLSRATAVPTYAGTARAWPVASHERLVRVRKSLELSRCPASTECLSLFRVLRVLTRHQNRLFALGCLGSLCHRDPYLSCVVGQGAKKLHLQLGLHVLKSTCRHQTSWVSHVIGHYSLPAP